MTTGESKFAKNIWILPWSTQLYSAVALLDIKMLDAADVLGLQEDIAAD
jgi:hypothetical protein